MQKQFNQLKKESSVAKLTKQALKTLRTRLMIKAKQGSASAARAKVKLDAASKEGWNILEGATGKSKKRILTEAAVTGSASGAAAGAVANADEMTFNTPTGAWGTLTYFCLFDAETGGNLLMSFALTDSRVLTTGNIPKFIAGALIITLG